MATALQRRVSALARRTAAGLARRLAFWSAVALPGFYLPLLSQGLTDARLPLFVGCVVLHAFALVVGHDHASWPPIGGSPDGSRTRSMENAAEAVPAASDGSLVD